jgi:hypothetical protein
MTAQIDLHVTEGVLVLMFGNNSRASQHCLHSRKQ